MRLDGHVNTKYKLRNKKPSKLCLWEGRRLDVHVNIRNHLNVSPFLGNEQSDSRDSRITFVELQSLIASEKFTNSFDQL